MLCGSWAGDAPELVCIDCWVGEPPIGLHNFGPQQFQLLRWDDVCLQTEDPKLQTLDRHIGDAEN